MGNANINNTPLNNKDKIIGPENNEKEKKTGKNIINSILAKFEILERKEININIKNPFLNISNRIKIINEEILDNILFDYYPNYDINLIASLNGYILIKECSLKDNNVQDNDDIFVSEPINIYFSFSDGNKFPIKVSKYQIFFNVFQRFSLKECPKEYKQRLAECYYRERPINSFDVIANLGIKENEEIFVVVGIDNNTKCKYDKGIEAIKRLNFIYKNPKEDKINLYDNKIELNNKVFDQEELHNFGCINFTNLKQLSLVNCKIQSLTFLNYPPLYNLQEINLQNNNISYFDDLYLNKLEIFDLSYNNLSKNMFSENNKQKIVDVNLSSLKILNLSNNKIEDISILCQFKIESLLELYLNNNEIENINAFNSISCGKLRILNLRNNKINDISIFADLSFCNNIENIDLMNNEIVNLNILRNISLPRLKILNLLNNDINDYTVFKLIFFPKLQILYAFPSQLDPDNYDKSSDIYTNFISSCANIKEKGVEIKFYL